MTSAAADALKQFRPTYGASLFATTGPNFTTEHLQAAITQIRPDVNIHFISDTPQHREGTGAVLFVMLIDGIAVGISHNPGKAHASYFDVKVDNIYVRNPLEAFASHTDLVSVFAVTLPYDLTKRVETARAVTVVAAAIMKLVSTVAIKWEDAKNFMPTDAFLDGCGGLLGRDSLAIPFLVRISTLTGSLEKGGPPVRLVSTYGMPLFGCRDIEIFSKEVSIQEAISLIYSTCKDILQLGSEMTVGGKVTFEGREYRVNFVDAGRISGWPVAELWDF
jgi:hypothetical protein